MQRQLGLFAVDGKRLDAGHDIRGGKFPEGKSGHITADAKPVRIALWVAFLPILQRPVGNEKWP